MSAKPWITEGFEAFSKGTFGNGGQNIYVSKKGVLQRIFQYDLDRNGYIDLVFANCQNHNESAPTYVYTLDGQRTELPVQGCMCGMVMDIDGDGYPDIVAPGCSDEAAPFASADIYFGTEKGYSTNYHIRLPSPRSSDCCYGDFSGKGKPAIVFALPVYNTVRIFEKSELDCYLWDEFQDLKPHITPRLVTAADLDGDGYDDLIVREEFSTKTVIYWGGPDGLSLEKYTDRKSVV